MGDTSFYCYLLCTESGAQTYVGATTDPERRLRQHNGELSGGARATAMRVARGQSWKRVCYISGIPEWRSALQIEWRWKQLSRTTFKNIRDPVERRLRALKRLLELEKPTEKGIPYDAYPSGRPEIIWENNDGDNLKEYETLYSGL